MRFLLLLLAVAALCGCDETRLYEKNHDFKNRYWLANELPSFDFTIEDTAQPINLYCNLRNSLSYPYSRIFIRYTLKDTTGAELKGELIDSYLFDKKTGEPQGTSGLGDIYDHQLPLLKNFKFAQPGKYTIQFEQFMRTDTLSGILAVGFRVEQAEQSQRQK
jgi:gliding motility-associated lipoprotein GldH